MKFFKYLALVCVLLLTLFSCEKEQHSKWDISLDQTVLSVKITDISKDFYNPAISLDRFKKDYEWFQGTVPDADYSARRKDTAEIKLYRAAIAKIDQKKLSAELADLFAHIKYYFPNFKAPKVYLFSSALQMAKDPVFLEAKNNWLFIDITGFMGENNSNYRGLSLYFQKSMNVANILPKVSELFAEQRVPPLTNKQNFLYRMIYEGKILTLQDAFLSKEPDYLKINYTSEQLSWAKSNEENIWNYFVENNLVFSDDQSLGERFLEIGPFSKFYTEIDNESSPQIGRFIGWQICRQFFNKEPDTKLLDFLKMDAQTIFNTAEYRPSK